MHLQYCFCVLLQAAFAHVASGARTANRVVAISKGEVENSEDVDFKRKLDAASGAVSTGMRCFLSLSQSLSPSFSLSLFLVHIKL